MEGTCNECVFPVNKEDWQSYCPTDTSLTYAAGKGTLSCVKELIAAGVDVNATCECHGNGPLPSAAAYGHVDCLRELLRAGADVNMESTDKKTSLMQAVEEGQIECLKELIAEGAEINRQDEAGYTVLMFAVYTGQNVIVEALTEAGCDINAETNKGETPLYEAVKWAHMEADRKQEQEESRFVDHFSGNVANVFTLLKAGAHMNESSTGLSPVTAHLQPRKLAIPNSYILKMLSAASADDKETKTFTSYVKSLQDLVRDTIRKHLNEIHPETNLYYTVLQLGLPHLLQSYLLYYTLLKNNNILKGDEKNFMTALMKTSEAGHVELVDKLIKTGPDKSIQDLLGDTALTLAVRTGQRECMEKLLKLRADADTKGTHQRTVDVNIKGKHGQTALVASVSFQTNDCMKELIDFGANVDILDDRGITALMYASNSFYCIDQLIQAGADVNKVSKEGFTAIIYSAEDGNVDCLRRLIDAGADVNSDSGRNQKNTINTGINERSGEMS